MYSWGELAGAGLILFGACSSALPPLLLPHSTEDLRWYAVLLYAVSNVPMAMSACYKQKNFQEHELDVWSPHGKVTSDPRSLMVCYGSWPLYVGPPVCVKKKRREQVNL